MHMNHGMINFLTQDVHGLKSYLILHVIKAACKISKSTESRSDEWIARVDGSEFATLSNNSISHILFLCYSSDFLVAWKY